MFVAKRTAVGISSDWLWNFVIVMITPVIINRKAYLISLCTKLAFVPLVFFSYSETTNLTLRKSTTCSPVPIRELSKLSRELHKERKRGIRQQSFVQRASVTEQV
jgi:hypothetical protein